MTSAHDINDNPLLVSDEKRASHIRVLKNNHDLFTRRACDQSYGCQADRIRAACDANNVADEFFALTGIPIEEMV
jgi:hypothetical protein